VDAFTSPARPVIAIDPTYELTGAVAQALGRPTVKVGLTAAYGADVKGLVEEAKKAGGGLIYICNPNNPTSSLTPPEDMAWLIANLPADTILLLDEAYLHFHPHPDRITALGAVKQGKNVVITRTFSKIYGMAGMRVGFAMARPELIAKMEPFRDNVISIVSARAALAALRERGSMIPQRRLKLLETRTALCDWLKRKGIAYIDPVANFMMIEVKKDPSEVRRLLYERGVAIGRTFPPLNNMIRVSIGLGPEMEKFRSVFERVLQMS
jgi:histidinol-phosphate/aromatic aminotransferase/cobyric acid decarboxylase-like protein